MNKSERFLILTRSCERVSASLCRNLSQFGQVEVIIDERPSKGGELNPIYISDEEARGYENLMSDLRNFPAITAWSRAFVHLAKTLRSGEAIWFVEDDVAGDLESFRELIEATMESGSDLATMAMRSRVDDRDWPWWQTAEGFFAAPWRSFNPLCRLSERLVRRVLKFREQHGRMTFHEVLFASLAAEEEMSVLNWPSDPKCKHLVANFGYRPVITTPVSGVCHPVKDLGLMEFLCQKTVSQESPSPAPGTSKERGNHSAIKMKSLEIIVIDYHRPGNAVRIANACWDAIQELDLDCYFHILCPPESESDPREFPEGVSFWPLDRNHGAQQRYSLAGEIQSEWSLYLDNDLVPTTLGLKRLIEAADHFGDRYSCYGWIGHNLENVKGGHLRAREAPGMEVDFVLRGYLYKSSQVRDAMLKFPIFHWEDDLNMQLKIQDRTKTPSWLVEYDGSLVDLGGHDAVAHYRQGGHFERRHQMVAGRASFRSRK